MTETVHITEVVGFISLQSGYTMHCFSSCVPVLKKVLPVIP